MGIMCQAIQQCRRHRRIAKDLAPATKLQIARDQHGAAFITLREELEQDLGLFSRQREISELAYRQAGADCIYVFGNHNRATIEQIVHGIDGSINVLAGPMTPSARELERMGVERVSIGGSAIEAALGLVRRIAHELYTEGTYASFLEAPMSYQEKSTDTTNVIPEPRYVYRDENRPHHLKEIDHWRIPGVCQPVRRGRPCPKGLLPRREYFNIRGRFTFV